MSRLAMPTLRLAWVVLAISVAVHSHAEAAIVLDDGHPIGTIDFDPYEPWYWFSPGEGKNPIGHTDRLVGDVFGGAQFGSVFLFSGCPDGLTLRPGLQFRWVQIVYTSDPPDNTSRGTAPKTGYVDPWTPPADTTGYEDDKPFYWTDAQWAALGIGGGAPVNSNALIFGDSSRRAFSDTPITWRAELNLVCTWDRLIHPLGYYVWGWTSPAQMLSDPTQTISINPTTPIWHNGASPGLAKLELPTEFGGPQGWQLTDDSCCIPEPSSIAIFSMCAGLGLVARNFKRQALGVRYEHEYEYRFLGPRGRYSVAQPQRHGILKRRFTFPALRGWAKERRTFGPKNRARSEA